MASPGTYRRGRIVEFVQRLTWRRESLSQQLTQPEFESVKENIIGQIQALDMVISEMVREFDIGASELS